MKPLNELVKEIDELMAKCQNNAALENPDLMSKVIVALASQLYTLSYYIAQSDRDEATQEELMKYTREVIIKEVIEGKRGEKKTVAYAEAIAREETQDMHKDYIEARYQHKLLSLKRLSVNTFIDTVRSRLSQKKQEINNTEVGT